MTRGDIEGRDQETDDDTEINPVYESGLVEMGETQAEKAPVGIARSAIVRPTSIASPEQWRPKRRVSAIVRQQNTKLTRVLAQLPFSDE